MATPNARAAAAATIRGALAKSKYPEVLRLASGSGALERRQLRELSDALLHDLGLTRSDIDAETAKPFWLP